MLRRWSVVMKQAIREDFFDQLTKVFWSHLSGTNKVRAYNGCVMSTLLYTFGVLRQTQSELDAWYRISTIMTHHRTYITQSCRL